MSQISKITLCTENGKRLDSNLNEKSKKGHILLGLVTSNSLKMDRNSVFLSPQDMDMLDKFRIDKTKSKFNHHFNTTGKIFSFGYGPKYEKNDHGYSIEKYVDKTSRKKSPQQRNNR